MPGLRRFIEDEVLPWFEARRRDLDNRPLVRERAFGEALDPDKLDRLGRYEVHLERKFERTLAMLLKLKDLRRPAMPDRSVWKSHLCSIRPLRRPLAPVRR